MAFIIMDMYSDSLKRNVSLTAILPSDIPEKKKINNPHYNRSLKTLYLLHGVEGSCFDWPLRSNLAEIAYKYNLAIFAPSAENIPYLDGEGIDRKYGQFIGKELVEKTRSMFNLSNKREDTFIAGASMGGRGALINGLMNVDTFNKIGSFAGAALSESTSKYNKQTIDFNDVIKDIKINHKENLTNIRIFVGKDDPGYHKCVKMAELCQENNLHIKFEEAEGSHNWACWNADVENMIKFFVEE